MLIWEIQSSQRVVVTRCHGHFSGRRLIQAERQIAQSPLYHPGFGRLFDFTAASHLKVGTREILDAVRLGRQFSMAEDARIALVAGSAEDAGVLQLFASHFPDQAMRVCRSVAAAMAWLRATTTDDGARGFRTMVARGRLTLERLFRLQTEWANSPDFDASTPVLWDLRDTTPGTPLSDAVGAAQSLLDVNPSGCRTAIVVNSHLMVMIAKQMVTAARWRGEHRLFRDYDAAARWLDTSEMEEAMREA